MAANSYDPADGLFSFGSLQKRKQYMLLDKNGIAQLCNCILGYYMPQRTFIFNIGIKHGFSCINIRQVPWEVLKTEAGGRGFQHLPRDLGMLMY